MATPPEDAKPEDATAQENTSAQTADRTSDQDQAEQNAPKTSQPEESPFQAAQQPSNARESRSATPSRESLPASTRRSIVLIALIAAVIIVIVVIALIAGTRNTQPSQTPEEQPAASSSEQGASSAQEQTPEPLSEPSAQTAALQTQVTTLLSSYSGASTGVSVTYLSVDNPQDGFAISGDTSHTSASMIKLLILADLLQQVDDGTISLETSLTMEATDVVGGSGEIQGSAIGTTYTVDELANYMIAASDNTATNMLIDALGMANINKEAQKLGLTGTSLERKMMDTEAQAKGLENKISSNDAAIILQKIASGTLVNEKLSKVALSYLKNQTIDAGLVAGINDVDTNVVVAHKTGELDLVENDGGIIYAAQGPYVLVVLTEGLSNGTEMQLIKDVSRTVYQEVSTSSANTAASVSTSPALTTEAGAGTTTTPASEPATDTLPAIEDQSLTETAPAIQ